MKGLKKKRLDELIRYYAGEIMEKSVKYRFEHDIYEWMKYHRLQSVYDDFVLNSYQLISDEDRDFFVNQQNEDKKKAEMQLRILNKVISKFENHGVQYILLKGNGIANSYYHQPWHRQFDDIDILIDYSDSPKAVKAVQELGYVQGWYWKGRIRQATRAEILHQQLFTHELFNMVKMYGSYESNIDINHKFGWLGTDGEKYKKLKFAYLYSMKKVIDIGQKQYFVFDDNLNFIHLCCHYYNGAVYFALDPDYKNDDPCELKLNRIFDIVILLDKIDKNVVKQLVCEFGVENEVKYVITIIKEITGNQYGFDAYNLDDSEMNFFYSKSLKKMNWPISVETRLYDIDKKDKCIQKMNMD